MLRSAASAQRPLLLLALCLLLFHAVQGISPTVSVSYEFTSDSEGWGGTVAGVFTGSAEVAATQWGTLSVFPPPLRSGRPAFIDSPLMNVSYSDDCFVVLRMRLGSGGGANPGTASLSWRQEPGEASSAPVPPEYNYSWPSASTHTLQFPTLGDGRFHTYAVPVHPSGRRQPYPSSPPLSLYQMRLQPLLHPASLSSSSAGPTGGLGAPQGAIELDFVRLVQAPTILRVEGCSPVQLWGASSSGGGLVQQDYTPTPLLQPPYRAVRRAPYALNAYYATPSAALTNTGASADSSLPWAATYNCARAGGDRVTITGLHFGAATPPAITVGGQPCTNVILEVPDRVASCTLPPLKALGASGGASGSANGGGVPVTLANGDMQVLFDSKPLLRYAAPPPPPASPPVVTNVASHSLALGWEAPSPQHRWAAMTITGYLVSWRGAVLDDASAASGGEGAVGRVSGAGLEGDVAERSSAAGSLGAGSRGVGSVTVSSAGSAGSAGSSGSSTRVFWGPWGGWPLGGEVLTDNRTHATLRGLRPGVRYQFRLAAVCEDTRGQWPGAATGLGAGAAVAGDSYGVRRGGAGSPSAVQRSPSLTLTPGALVGDWTLPSASARTLLYDFYFAAFDANSTLDWGPVHGGSSMGSAGWAGGEGHYGLSLVGSATLASASASAVCCDSYGGGGGFLDAARQAALLESPRYAGLSSGTPGRGERALDAFSPNSPGVPPPPPPAYLWSGAAQGGLGWHALLANSSAWREARRAVLNTGTLPAHYSPSSPGCAGSGSASGSAEATTPGQLQAGQLCLQPGRLHTPDSLLQRLLGVGVRPAGGWATQGADAAGPAWASSWAVDEYEDTGTLKLVPASVLWDLGNASAGGEEVEAALAALERARRGGYAVGAGVAWAGQWVAAGGAGDARVSPLEAGKGPRGPGGQPGPAPPYPWTFQYPGTDPSEGQRGAQPGNLPPRAPRALYGAGAMDPQMPGLPEQVQGAPAPLPAKAFHDRLGRRLLAWPADPTASCAAVCIGSGEAVPGVALNLGVLRDEDREREGLAGYGRGRESILPAAEEAQPGGGNATGQQWEGGGAAAPPPATATPITGRLSGAPLPWATSYPPSRHYSWHTPHPLQPRPHTSFPSPTVCLPAGAAPALTRNATAPCGPALRLTPPSASATGGAWYARGVEVREGFDTAFLFRHAAPSAHCRTHNDVATRCGSGGGGAGFALVLQTAHPGALGNGSSGLGYDGLVPSLAVEFDSWADDQLGDPGGGGVHISVHSRGAVAGNSANESYSLGGGFPPAALQTGVHSARVRYSPWRLRDDPGLAQRAEFVASPHATSLMLGGGGGGGGWGGVLEVWVDADSEAGQSEPPVLAVPCNLEQLLGLGGTGGRAWVGFTAATGEDIWQQHDILAWHFSSLREV